MVLRLYGSAMSTSRVLVTIPEKELPYYERIFVDIAEGEQKTNEFKKLQPFGKVPVLEDDGSFMFESRAICRYLAKKACARFEEACSIEQNHFAIAAETIGTELIIKP
ncbi:hypothetical protein BTUL_0018g00210 [Botrytis tulipae]|uniref:glutathione transferase n=1 Tax=Botrytis tulipae TaxID=87230 RepID=A0A4Z1EYK5_9HELO|nr:hypothetical protein BTUL_0018g00210 [Botrytis tulipae]